MKNLCLIAAVIVAIALTGSFAQDAPADKVVRTSLGSISGVLTRDAKIAVFKGIPYAQPPVGPLRWREPQPAPAWSQTLRADHFSNNCIQPLVRNFLPWTKEYMLGNDVSEDCLYLNIWTPASAAAGSTPVYAFIHGGGFTGGSGDVTLYDGENLARQGIVVITLNYRLGVLGFLAHPELTRESLHHASGNYGLLDQLAALHWISSNIAPFGGDPARLTIGGQSAGAAAVGDLVASPLARNLFRSVVAESGSGAIPFPLAPLSEAEKAGESYAAAKNASNLAALRAIPAKDIAPPADIHVNYPVLDGWLLSETPADAFASGTANDVPTITGWNADDVFGHAKNAEDFRKQSAERFGPLLSEFLTQYPASSEAEASASEKAATRDRNRVSEFIWAQRRAATAKTPAYLYFFTRAIPWPEHPEFGAFHSGEIPYIFANLNRLERPWNDSDRAVAKGFSSFLVSFVENAKPSGWPAFDPALKQVLQIGAETKPIPLASPAKQDFWFRYFHSDEAKKAPLF